MVMTAISMGPALKILRSRYTAEEKAAAEAEKRALEKEWALGRLKKREQVILEAIENIENGRISDKENG